MRELKHVGETQMDGGGPFLRRHQPVASLMQSLH